MFVSEILEESKDVLGRCSEAVVFRRITDAVRLANMQSKVNDWNIGQMDICVCDGCVTLPADVGTLLALNNAGMPTLIRDQWYQFHANGGGSDDCVDWPYTNELGPVVTFKDPPLACKLVAVVENTLDTNTATLRVFGWDVDGKRIYTTGPSGVLEDGFLVPLFYGFPTPNPEAPAIARIDRIQKSISNGFIKLIAIDETSGDAQTVVGYYQPWETVPSYRRFRVSDRSWVRIKYRRKDIEVRGSGDWINIDNREALILLLKAIKFRLDNQIDTARQYEMEGMRLLSNEASALKPPGLSAPQIIMNVFPAQNDDTLFF